MKPWLSEALFWAAIGFVGCSFLLGGIGVEISSGPQAELTLGTRLWVFSRSSQQSRLRLVLFIARDGLARRFAFGHFGSAPRFLCFCTFCSSYSRSQAGCSLVCQASSLRFLDSTLPRLRRPADCFPSMSLHIVLAAGLILAWTWG
jgi:hypothetical protein